MKTGPPISDSSFSADGPGQVSSPLVFKVCRHKFGTSKLDKAKQKKKKTFKVNELRIKNK
jgi:hypothetical protein